MVDLTGIVPLTRLVADFDVKCRESPLFAPECLQDLQLLGHLNIF
jgi:hypothetical protein